MTDAREEGSDAQFLAPDVLPAFGVQWFDDGAIWTMGPSYEPWAVHEAEPTLLGCEPIIWRFAAPAVSLTSLTVTLAAWGRRNTTPIWTELVDVEGVIVRRQYTPADQVQDGAPTLILSLDGLPFNLGARYTVKLTAPTARHGDGFACYRISSDPGRYIYARRIERFCERRTFLPSPLRSEGLVLLLCGLSEIEAAEAFTRILPLAAGSPIRVEAFESIEVTWPLVKTTEIVCVAGAGTLTADVLDPMLFALFRLGVCTISICVDRPLASLLHVNGAQLPPNLERLGRSRAAADSRCAYDLRPDGSLRNRLSSTEDRLTLNEALTDLRRRRNPCVVVASVMYRKQQIIGRFLSHIERQSYDGEIIVSLIDDCSPEADAQEASRVCELWSAKPDLHRRLILKTNSSNLGNCISRDRAIAAAVGDIYVIIDCDCLLNADFIASHVFEHAIGDAEIVVGYLNIESWNDDPEGVLATLSLDPALLSNAADPQDPIQPDGFLNCITRNFSIAAAAIGKSPLFDPDFSYSAKPGGGFGWEDVEMGYRLYRRGLRIRFSELAFCVHATHASAVGVPAQIAGSMRNFERLFEKHPDLAIVARRWALGTYARLTDWGDSQGIEVSDARKALDKRFALERAVFAPLLSALRPRTHHRLRILSYRWHAPHQYELHKLPHDFTYATALGNGMLERWPYEQRPLRPNVTFRSIDRIDPREFDVALLHFDENVLAPELCNGVIPPHWGDPFRALLALDLPKVAICHGTPSFHGQYGLFNEPITSFTPYEEERRRLVEVIAGADARVVCNSFQALEEWKFRSSQVIWHGFDPQQFPMGRHDRLLLTPETDFARPHYRGAWAQQEILRALSRDIAPGSASDRETPPVETRASNGFATRNLRRYAEQIGRYQLYLNTTLRSPMPRARGEAMMTGVAPICLANHDVERFIDQGVDGFFSNDADELADFISFVSKRPTVGLGLSEGARRKATDVFNHDRFMNDWSRLLSDVIG